jgi:O-antigen ligase
MIALVVSFGLLLLIEWTSGRPARALVKGAAATALSVPAIFLLEQRLGFAIMSRFRAALDAEERGSVTERVEMFRGARDQFLSSPITGSSLEERGWLTYPHNTFIESFMATGLIGGVAYLTFHVGALWSAARLALFTPSAAWLTILCVQYSLSALFSGSLYVSNTMWAMLAAVVATESRRSVEVRSAGAIPVGA